MSVPMIQIMYEDGRITRIPEICVEDAFGENIQPELEIRLDDLSDGIWIYLRHNEPIRPKQGDHQKQDPRGLACNVFADSFYQIATRDDIEKSIAIYYEGKPWIVRHCSELICLSRVNTLMDIYVGGSNGTIAADVAAVANALVKVFGIDAQDNQALASRMGIPVSYLDWARKAEDGNYDKKVADAEAEALAAVYDCA